MLTLEYAISSPCMPPLITIKLKMTVKIEWVYEEPFFKLINDYHLDQWVGMRAWLIPLDKSTVVKYECIVLTGLNADSHFQLTSMY